MLNANSVIFENDKLDQALSKKKVIFKTKALFPFQLAPDEIIIDTFKVSFVYNVFLGTRTVETILFDNIGDLDIDVSFLFGALKILSLSHNGKWFEITHLKKDNAIKAKRILEGILIANKENISLENYTDVDKLAEKLEKLGSSL